jgi:hypothetical protein
MQACPLVHSELTSQSWAPVAPPGHEPPAATVWHAVDAVEPFSVPQQTWPLGQSQACVHPKVTDKPEHPLALGEQLQVPTTVPLERPVTLKQQSFVRRSQLPLPHAFATYEEQRPASPPELLDDDPPLDDEEPPPDEELPPDDEALPEDEPPLDDDPVPDEEPTPDEEPVPDDEPTPEDELPDEDPLDDDPPPTVASIATPASRGAPPSLAGPRPRRQ